MAGNPLAKYFPVIKKNAVQIFIGAGVLFYLKHQWDIHQTYKFVYSRNDFERKYHLDALKNYIEQQKSQH